MCGHGKAVDYSSTASGPPSLAREGELRILIEIPNSVAVLYLLLPPASGGGGTQSVTVGVMPVVGFIIHGYNTHHRHGRSPLRFLPQSRLCRVCNPSIGRYGIKA